MKRMPALIFLLAATPVVAAKLETSVEPREVRVGDRLTFTVTIATAAKEAPLPFAPPDGYGSFELVSAAPLPAGVSLTLATFEVGTATIPALSFAYAGADGKRHSLKTPEIFVPVKSVLAPGTPPGLKDIKGDFRSPPMRIGPWALVLLALAGAGVLIWWWKGKPAIFSLTPPAPPVPPDVTALEALEKLEALMEGPSKPYYSRLTDILRTYIEGRFALSALDRTTAEMVPLLKELPLAAQERMELRETLETADLAKFARFESPADERRAHRDRVRAFVLSTRPRPPEPAAPA